MIRLENQYDELDRLITIVAKKFCTSCEMEYEDLYQDLWVEVLEKDFKTLGLANRSLHNICCTLYQKRKRRLPECLEDYSDYDSEAYVIHNLSEKPMVELSTEFNVQKMLSELDDKKRKYVVAKLYTTSFNPELHSEYLDLVRNLAPEIRIRLVSLDVKAKDDLIARYILGYQNGTHSGSFRLLKKSLRELFKKNLIY
jgi:hypothetical protein